MGDTTRAEGVLQHDQPTAQQELTKQTNVKHTLSTRRRLCNIATPVFVCCIGTISVKLAAFQFGRVTTL